MKEKVSEAKKRLIKKDRKKGLTVGELSWKYNITVPRIMDIIKNSNL